MQDKTSSLRAAAERQMRRPAPSSEETQAKRLKTELPDHAEIGRYAYQAVNLLEHGTLGLLVTCDMKREKTATAEVDGLLQQLAKEQSITGMSSFAGYVDEADVPQQPTAAASTSASRPLTLLRAKVDCRGLALLLWPAAATHRPHSQSAAQSSPATQQQASLFSAAADEMAAAAPSTPVVPACSSALQPSSNNQDPAGAKDISIEQGQPSKELQGTPAPPAPGTSGDPVQAPASAALQTPTPAANDDPVRLLVAAAEAQADTSAEPGVAAAASLPDPSAQLDAAGSAHTGPAIGVTAAADAANGLHGSHTASKAATAGRSPGEAMLGLPVKLVRQLLDGVEGSRYSRPKSCQRVVPLSWTCAWTADALRSTAYHVTAAYLSDPASKLLQDVAFAVQCKMRGPENQAGHKGTAGAGPGVASRSQCIPLLAAAMEAAFKGAGVAAHVNLRDPKVVLFAEAIPSSGRLFCGMAMVPEALLDTLTSRGPILRHLSRK